MYTHISPESICLEEALKEVMSVQTPHQSAHFSTQDSLWSPPSKSLFHHPFAPSLCHFSSLSCFFLYHLLFFLDTVYWLDHKFYSQNAWMQTQPCHWWLCVLGQVTYLLCISNSSLINEYNKNVCPHRIIMKIKWVTRKVKHLEQYVGHNNHLLSVRYGDDAPCI